MNAIELCDVNKSYDSFSLNHVSFSVPKGCVVGLIGENGAGKSTTLKAILNLIRIDSGSILLFGKDHKQQEILARENIGVVFEECEFPPYLNASEVSGVMKNIYRSWDTAAFSSYLKQFNLPVKKRVKEYSRGMKMKLSIAAALAHHPSLLILDEATSGLDPIVREEILDILREFIQTGENSILLSSHITTDLDKIADYITFIHDGRIMFHQPKDDLTDRLGILRCSREDLATLAPGECIRCRQNAFGMEALVRDRAAARRKFPAAVIDPVTIEDIMLFYIRGEQI